MEEVEEAIMNIEAIAKDTPPLLWTTKLTSRLLNEFKRLSPQLGITIRSQFRLHSIIASILKKEFKCEVTGRQVCNKLKSIKRKYNACKDKRRAIVEFGPALEEVMMKMEQINSAKSRMREMNSQAVAVFQNVHEPDSQPYSVEIVDDCLGGEDEVMHLLKSEAGPSQGASSTTCPDPLEGDVVDYGEKARKKDANKLSLLEKKIETQERNLEERQRKNELIEERNRLIGSLLAKKAKSDVVDSIRKDRLLHHREMKDLWIERLELEKKKLEEKKRRNDLLEEKNQLMKAILQELNKKSGNVLSSSTDGESAT